LKAITLLTAASFIVAPGCAPAQPKSVPLISQRVVAQAGAIPEPCTAEDREAPRASWRLLVFTSDWCDACETMLAALRKDSVALAEHDIDVLNLVTGQGDRCVDAARVGERWPFAYAAAPVSLEREWSIRSTPTSWLVDPNGQTRLYSEGVVGVGDIIAAAATAADDLP
jgi:hypothetical protein